MSEGPRNDHTEAPCRGGVVERGTPKRGQVHGILKSHSSNLEKVAGGPGVVWDEVTIAEHDKDRGTRMKIDEPNTPYYHLGSNEELILDETCVPIALPDSAVFDSTELEAVRNGAPTQDPQFVGLSATEISKAKHKISKRKAEAVNPNELFARLQQCAVQRVADSGDTAVAAFARSRSVQLSSESLEAEEAKSHTPEDMAKKDEFEKRRKAHYTEFLRMQECRRSGTLDSDNDDNEDEVDGDAES